MKIKSAPIHELTVAAVVYAYGKDDTGYEDIEVSVRNKASYERYEAAGSQLKNRCACCGRSISWTSVIEHLPTGTFWPVGRACAEKIENLQPLLKDIARATVALGERVTSERRERAFRATASTEVIAALDWAKTGVNDTAKDIAAKLRSRGALSEKQIAFLVNLHKRDLAYRASLTGGLAAGKQTLTGTVLSTRVQTDLYTRGAKDITKALIQLANGCKVWGTAPAGTAKGAEVSFSATVEVSAKDPAFGFYKRPTKWVTGNPLTPTPAHA